MDKQLQDLLDKIKSGSEININIDGVLDLKYDKNHPMVSMIFNIIDSKLHGEW